MGYKKSALESSIRTETAIINKCNEVLKQCDNYQNAFDKLFDKIDNGTDAGGSSDCYISLNMINTLYSQETLDKYDEYLMMSYLEFKEAYNAGENVYSFFDEIIEGRENIIECREDLIGEFNRMKERYNYYLASVDKIRKSMNNAISIHRHDLEIFQNALNSGKYDEYYDEHHDVGGVSHGF